MIKILFDKKYNKFINKHKHINNGKHKYINNGKH